MKKEKKKRINYFDNQFKIDRNCKGHVAQWIEPLADARGEVGSKLLRKSHHAREYPENKEDKNNKIKEKQAYSPNRKPFRRTRISHESKSFAGINQNPQHNNLSINNYIKLSVG